MVQVKLPKRTSLISKSNAEVNFYAHDKAKIIIASKNYIYLSLNLQLTNDRRDE